MKPITHFLFVAALLLYMAACHPIDKQKVTGGKGGHVTIKAMPMSNGRPLSNSMVYIKYAATDLPSNSVYDDSLQCVMIDSLPAAIFTGLTTGMYYVYAKGYDTTDHQPQLITGGARVSAPVEDTIKVYPPVPEL